MNSDMIIGVHEFGKNIASSYSVILTIDTLWFT